MERHSLAQASHLTGQFDGEKFIATDFAVAPRSYGGVPIQLSTGFSTDSVDRRAGTERMAASGAALFRPARRATLGRNFIDAGSTHYAT